MGLLLTDASSLLARRTLPCYNTCSAHRPLDVGKSNQAAGAGIPAVDPEWEKMRGLYRSPTSLFADKPPCPPHCRPQPSIHDAPNRHSRASSVIPGLLRHSRASPSFPGFSVNPGPSLRHSREGGNPWVVGKGKRAYGRECGFPRLLRHSRAGGNDGEKRPCLQSGPVTTVGQNAIPRCLAAHLLTLD